MGIDSINWDIAIAAAEKAVKAYKFHNDTDEEVNTLLALLAEPRAKYMLKYTYGDRTDEKVNKLAVSMKHLRHEKLPEYFSEEFTVGITVADASYHKLSSKRLTRPEIEQVFQRIKAGVIGETESLVSDRITNSLTELQRQAIKNTYFLGNTVKQAAEIMGCTESALRRRIFRAFDNLKYIEIPIYSDRYQYYEE